MTTHVSVFVSPESYLPDPNVPTPGPPLVPVSVPSTSRIRVSSKTSGVAEESPCLFMGTSSGELEESSDSTDFL